jgi:NAD(P)-dependent dehydrogenase (short-subunit alcohol dehydrogenase family)
VIFDTVSYAVTKHASIGLTEWLAATYIDQGIGVSVLCPAAVRTPILAGPARRTHPKAGAAISTDELADTVIERLEEERFMISPTRGYSRSLRSRHATTTSTSR